MLVKQLHQIVRFNENNTLCLYFQLKRSHVLLQKIIGSFVIMNRIDCIDYINYYDRLLSKSIKSVYTVVKSILGCMSSKGFRQIAQIFDR